MSKIRLENSYRKLGENFYVPTSAAANCNPQIIRFNDPLAQFLGMNITGTEKSQLNRLFSGESLFDGSAPIALAYAGHQFGHFVPQLGDGRALLLGEIVDPRGQSWDIQLKGSGPTAFSRGGDGRAALGPVIREYVVSEAMHALGIPTTRCLAFLSTGEKVNRDEVLPGAIVVRVAASHIRVGSFEFFASRGDWESVKALAEFAIQRHCPEWSQDEQRFRLFFSSVLEKQAALIAQWMLVGFIHGVMNTDNTAISGETLDYGPCAFMDEFSLHRVFSSIDRQGRYAYVHQAAMAQWNLQQLGACLLPLLGKGTSEASAWLTNELNRFQTVFNEHWLRGWQRKLGWQGSQPDDLEMISDLFQLMEKAETDFTVFFRNLSEFKTEIGLTQQLGGGESAKKWLQNWRARAVGISRQAEDVSREMKSVNPAVIPRNHRVAEVIEASVQRGDFQPLDDLQRVLRDPFSDLSDVDLKFAEPPLPHQKVTKTFCGT